MVRNRAKCHPDRLAYGHGLCQICYNSTWQKEHPKDKKKRLPHIDLTGKHFTNLEVVRQADYIRTGRRLYVAWHCKCVCGTEKAIRGDHLRSGLTRSCGCLKGKIVADRTRCGKISGSFWSYIEHRAIARKMQIDLTIEQAWALFQSQDSKCAISGTELNINNSRQSGQKITASLDRIDSDLGYTYENVQWVHVRINFMKGSLKDAEFINWCKKVAEYNK